MSIFLYLIGGPADLTKIVLPEHPGPVYNVPILSKAARLEQYPPSTPPKITIAEYEARQVNTSTYIGVFSGMFPED